MIVVTTHERYATLDQFIRRPVRPDRALSRPQLQELLGRIEGIPDSELPSLMEPNLTKGQQYAIMQEVGVRERRAAQSVANAAVPSTASTPAPAIHGTVTGRMSTPIPEPQPMPTMTGQGESALHEIQQQAQSAKWPWEIAGEEHRDHTVAKLLTVVPEENRNELQKWLNKNPEFVLAFSKFLPMQSQKKMNKPTLFGGKKRIFLK